MKNQIIFKFIGNHLNVYNLNNAYSVTITKPIISLSNQTLKIFGFRSFLKTKTNKNSICTNEIRFILAGGLNSIVLSQYDLKLLKFVIAH